MLDSTTPNPNSNVPNSTTPSKKPIIPILIGIIVVLAIALISVTAYEIGRKKGERQAPSLAGQGPQAPGNIVGFPNEEMVNGQTQGEKIVISEKEKLPNIMTGKVASVDSGKLTLKQFSNLNLNYEINKDDVSEIISYQKNPEFDQEKSDKLQEEMAKKLAKQVPSPVENNNVNEDSRVVQAPPIPNDVAKQIENDPTLKMLNEGKGDWSDIKEGVQISVTIKQDKKAKIELFPNDFQLGPPEGFMGN